MMTNIELQFFESAVNFFRKRNSHKIDWEQRRYETASRILSGMAANYHYLCPNPRQVEDAVKLADELISILKNRPLQYSEKIFTNIESECSAENQAVTK